MSLAMLSNDLLFHIIGYLSPADWSALTRTCKYLRKLSMHDERVWKVMLFRDFPCEAASREFMDDAPSHYQHYSDIRRLLALTVQEDEETNLFKFIEPEFVETTSIKPGAIFPFFYLRAPLRACEMCNMGRRIDIVPDYVIQLSSWSGTKAFITYFGGAIRDPLIPHPALHEEDWEWDPEDASDKFMVRALKDYTKCFGPVSYLELSDAEAKEFAFTLIDLGYATALDMGHPFLPSLYKNRWIYEPNSSPREIDVWPSISDLFYIGK
jgi:hypothetical protein